jgi:hypothetical protein
MNKGRNLDVACRVLSSISNESWSGLDGAKVYRRLDACNG